MVLITTPDDDFNDDLAVMRLAMLMQLWRFDALGAVSTAKSANLIPKLQRGRGPLLRCPARAGCCALERPGPGGAPQSEGVYPETPISLN